MAGRKVALDYTHNVSRKISFIPPPEGTFSKNFAKAIFSALINSAHALPFRKLSELKSIFSGISLDKSVQKGTSLWLSFCGLLDRP